MNLYLIHHADLPNNMYVKAATAEEARANFECLESLYEATNYPDYTVLPVLELETLIDALPTRFFANEL